MSQREATSLWLKDTLEHLATSHQQLEWTRDQHSANVLLEAMLRDLETCRRLCESMRRRTPERQPV